MSNASDELTIESALAELREMFPEATVGVEQFSVAPDRRFFHLRVAGKVKGHGTTLSEAMAKVHAWRKSQ